MKFDLDLTRAAPRPSRLGWVLLVMGIIAVVMAGARYETESKRLIGAQAMLQKYSKPAPPAKSSAPLASGARQRAHALETEDPLTLDAKRILDADWSFLLNTLEDLRPDDIALVGLKASVAGNKLRHDPLVLTANARSLSAMFAYVASLQAAGFTRVSLDKHTEQEDAGEKVIRFTVHAGWDGQTVPGEGAP